LGEGEQSFTEERKRFEVLRTEFWVHRLSVRAFFIYTDGLRRLSSPRGAGWASRDFVRSLELRGVSKAAQFGALRCLGCGHYLPHKSHGTPPTMRKFETKEGLASTEK
jgi:hypothetical protein